MVVRIGRCAVRYVRGRNIAVRLGVSISDQASAQPFNLDTRTRRRNHGVKELAKMFGNTRGGTRHDIRACLGEERKQPPDFARAYDCRCER
jgi:hypothetical protein